MQLPPLCEFESGTVVLKIDIVVASEVAAVDSVVDEIVRQIEQTGYRDGLEVELALREALANAILHGNQRSPSKAVRICVALLKSGEVRIVVKDMGEGFDPSQVADPLEGKNLLAGHGRGIFLIRRLMDKVRFRFAGSGTEVEMTRFAGPRG